MNTTVSPIETLKSARREKAGQLANVMEARERLRTAESEEATLLGLIGALGASEVAAMREWATSGSEGEPPMCDAAERTRLNERLVQAQTQAQAAKGASADLEVERASITHEMQELSAKIEFMSIDLILAEHARSHADLVVYAETVRERVAKTFACHAAMVQRANNLAKTSPQVAHAYLRNAEKIANANRPSLEPSKAEVMAAVPAWDHFFAELTRDQPVKQPEAIIDLAPVSADPDEPRIN